jgi:Cof subfamily protein (haloacid dehalogenase superfamily)
MIDLSLSGILLITDLDGTLVTDMKNIPERNITAIRRFVKKGGRFAFATGRSVMGTFKYAAQVPLNAPCIVYNGAGIFDFQTEKMLWSQYLPRESAGIIKAVRTSFPDVGIEAYSDGYVYSINQNKYSKEHIVIGALSGYDKYGEEAPENLNKILFTCDNERLKEVAVYLEKLEHTGCAYVFSAPIYFEVLPDGVSKGTTAKLLADMLDIRHDKIMGIGDYYNDLELIEISAFGAVPSGAPDDMKRAADLVVGKCEDGAVADFIEYLEAKFEPLAEKL